MNIVMLTVKRLSVTMKPIISTVVMLSVVMLSAMESTEQAVLIIRHEWCSNVSDGATTLSITTLSMKTKCDNQYK